ncbi:hypothetical protein D3C72_1909680 [compost metagenome]
MKHFATSVNSFFFSTLLSICMRRSARGRIIALPRARCKRYFFRPAKRSLAPHLLIQAYALSTDDSNSGPGSNTGDSPVRFALLPSVTGATLWNTLDIQKSAAVQGPTEATRSCINRQLLTVAHRFRPSRTRTSHRQDRTTFPSSLKRPLSAQSPLA